MPAPPPEFVCGAAAVCAPHPDARSGRPASACSRRAHTSCAGRSPDTGQELRRQRVLLYRRRARTTEVVIWFGYRPGPAARSQRRRGRQVGPLRRPALPGLFPVRAPVAVQSAAASRTGPVAARLHSGAVSAGEVHDRILPAVRCRGRIDAAANWRHVADFAGRGGGDRPRWRVVYRRDSLQTLLKRAVETGGAAPQDVQEQCALALEGVVVPSSTTLAPAGGHRQAGGLGLVVTTYRADRRCTGVRWEAWPIGRLNAGCAPPAPPTPGRVVPCGRAGAGVPDLPGERAGGSDAAVRHHG